MIDKKRIEIYGIKLAKGMHNAKEEYMEYLLRNATMYEMAELLIRFHKLYVKSRVDNSNRIDITLNDFQALCRVLRIKGVKEIKSNGEFVFDNRGVKTGRPSEDLPLYTADDTKEEDDDIED